MHSWTRTLEAGFLDASFGDSLQTTTSPDGQIGRHSLILREMKTDPQKVLRACRNAKFDIRHETEVVLDCCNPPFD